jgi:hypothetical protein
LAGDLDSFKAKHVGPWDESPYVYVQMQVQNVSYPVLAAGDLLPRFKEMISSAFAMEVMDKWPGTNVEVSLLGGSVIANVVVSPPQGIALADVQTQLASSESLMGHILANIRGMSGIGAALVGNVDVITMVRPSIRPERFSRDNVAPSSDTYFMQKPCFASSMQEKFLIGVVVLLAVVAAMLVVFVIYSCCCREEGQFKCRIISDKKVGILTDPHILSEVTGYLASGSVFYAVDKVTPADGRTYFQLADRCGWVPECSRKDIDRPVVVLDDGNARVPSAM